LNVKAIDACSKTRGEGKHQVEALKIAFAILKTMEIDPNVQPNDVTYNNILKAVGFLLPDSEERNQIARAAFDKAKANGMISVDVIRSVRKAMDNKTMRETLHPLEMDSGTVEYSKIPNAWHKNVLNR
jgi:Ca2+-binding EF-hand superfamily protein